jgi:hypothetical protein
LGENGNLFFICFTVGDFKKKVGFNNEVLLGPKYASGKMAQGTPSFASKNHDVINIF